MKIQKILLLILISSLFTLFSCNNSKGKKNNTQGEQCPMPEGFTLRGLNINDSLGKIKGSVIVPISTEKNNPIPSGYIVDFIHKEFKGLALYMESKEVKDKYSFIETKPVYFYADRNNVSCLVKKSSSYAGGDTVCEYKTITYDYKNKKELTFDDVFLVTESNLSNFLALFDKSMQGLEMDSVKKIDFNVENDSISFNYKKGSIQNRYKQSRKNLKKYLNKTLL